MQCLRKCPIIGPCISKCLGDDDDDDAAQAEAQTRRELAEAREALEKTRARILESDLKLAEYIGEENKLEFNNPPPDFGSHGTHPVLARKRWEDHTSKEEQDKILKKLKRRGQALVGEKRGSPKHWRAYGEDRPFLEVYK